MTSLALLNISAMGAARRESGIQSVDEKKFLADRSGAGDASLWVCERTRLFTHAWGGIKKFGPPGGELVKFLIFALGLLRRTVNLFHACPNFTR